MGSERHNAVISPITPTKNLLPPDVSASDVRKQLERITASQQFRSSRRCVVFLDFVIHAALDGRVESLKERTIGIDVFSRDPNYDTNQDPVVRGTASEVRKRLAQYYQVPGRERELRIDLPAGSYLPEIHLPIEAAPPKPAELPVAAPVASRRPWLRLSALGAVIAAAIAAGIILFPRLSYKPQTLLDQFWSPMLQSSDPVLVCVGQPKVYNLVGPLEEEMSKQFPGPGQAPSGAAANQKFTFALSGVVPNWDRYLALGDAMCLSDMTALLARHGHVYHIRGGGSTSFADLRESPAILIGAFTNDWTLRLMGHLRFTFEYGPDAGTHYVYDRLHPANRSWQLSDVWPDWKMPMDYAIVSRVLDPATGKMVIEAAGITQYGTAAAGEFVTNPDYLAQLIRQAPADWQHKNLQAVLATKVIDGTAGPPQVLATNFW